MRAWGGRGGVYDFDNTDLDLPDAQGVSDQTGSLGALEGQIPGWKSAEHPVHNAVDSGC